MTINLTLRIRLVNPPKNVGFCIQKGRNGLVDYKVSTGSNIIFEFPVKIKEGKEGQPNFLGEFTQGTVKDRFIYVCVGKSAGQHNSSWKRRAKIRLSSIIWEQIKIAASDSERILTASYNATGKDGGPSCASVPLIDGRWRIEECANGHRN